MKKKRAILSIIVVLVAIILLIVETFLGVDGKGLYSAKDIKLGLDLAGGVSITYQAKGDPSSQDMDDTLEKLKKRVEGYSNESEVYKEGTNRINVEIPGVTDVNKVLAELGKPGSLSFRSEEAISVANEKQNALIQQILKNSKEEAQKKQYEQIKDKLTDEQIKAALEKKDLVDVITGNDVTSAKAVTRDDQTTGKKQYDVILSLTSDGSKKFGDFTSKNIGKKLYIVYDNGIVSAPTIQAAITNGEVSITGQANMVEAEKLATTIRIGSLPVELEEIRSNVVGAKLGQEAIATSLTAGIIGLIIVMLFMIIIYRWSGFIGSIALGFYSVLIIFLISAFQLTLTLEGIAGIILSIGMAIDANIIIFTRIREEIGLGRDVKSSIEEGFKKALSAIVDGNITTLIAAGVLWAIGTGSIKGFAQTLTLGILLSMFTALFITKLLIKAFYAIGFKAKRFYGRIKPIQKAFDFLKYKLIFIVVSLAIVATGIGFMIYNHNVGNKSLNYSLEFSGGTLTNINFPENYTLEQVDSKVKPAVAEITKDNDIRAQKVKDTNKIVIKTRNLTLDERTKLEQKLITDFKVKKDEITSENISATISGEMRSKAVTSAIVAGVLMLIYIWFRFKNIRFGASSVIALLHDCLIILAFYAIARISVGNSFIAVILTIIGYSINATIVVFDRVRENMVDKKYKDKKELVNVSITQTFTRCLYTSLTVAIMAFMLYILGVDAMKDFALPLLVGVIGGTWSSIGISGALYYIFDSKLNKKAIKAK